ncbi:hypothetical protein B6D60_01455 [candidate division KSB1 bacterium 4484_87]|nr:MAG: hypothetical protein B6D60_01455 [candidate division KSB1 bacterium 4484_87]
MEKVQELFVILEDKPRALGELMKILSNNDVKILSIGVFVDSAKLIVNEPEETKKLLLSHNYAVEIRDVLKVQIDNSPKELAYITERIGHVGINISHAYGTTNARTNQLTLILDVADVKTALSLFS